MPTISKLLNTTNPMTEKVYKDRVKRIKAAAEKGPGRNC
jgi:hypothetical protein